MQNELGDTAQVWQDHGRDSAYTYVGDRLQSVLAALTQARLTPTGLANAFLTASRAEDYKRQRAAFLGQAAGIGVGSGLGFGIFFALDVTIPGRLQPQDAQLLSNFTALIFDSTIPLGVLVGISVGLAVWIMRAKTRLLCLSAAMAGGATGALAYTIYRWAIVSGGAIPTPSIPNYAAAGGVLGLSVGLGVALGHVWRGARWVTPLLTIPAMFIANTFVPSITTNDVLARGATWVLAGLALGLATALGQRATAVRRVDVARYKR